MTEPQYKQFTQSFIDMLSAAGCNTGDLMVIGMSMIHAGLAITHQNDTGKVIQGLREMTDAAVEQLLTPTATPLSLVHSGKLDS